MTIYRRNLLPILLLTLLLFTMLCSFSVLAIDTIKMTRSVAQMDKRTAYKIAILEAAMEATVDKFGSYQVEHKVVQMNRERGLTAVISGEHNNVYIAPSNNEWNNKTLAIKIPVRMGLLSYRLLMVHKDDLAKFSKVHSLADLKRFKAGLRFGWVTTDIFKHLNFNIVESQNFHGLFFLLNQHKFDFIPRSIYEIFDEIRMPALSLTNVVIEPNIALYIPTSTYVYVSPKEPRLAKRLATGLNTLFTTGKLAQILQRFYGEEIKQAKLDQRRIIYIENPYYPEQDRLNDQKYWYFPH